MADKDDQDLSSIFSAARKLEVCHPEPEPLNRVDAAWLRMDEPGNLMIINAVMMLEDRLPFERYRDLVIERLSAIPRLRQRVVGPVFGIGAQRWEQDGDFDPDYHVRLAPIERADQASLEELVGRLMSEELDHHRPLWQFHFVPEYEGGCAVIARFHHCIGDGLALLYVMLAMTDQAPRAAEPPAAAGSGSLWDYVWRPVAPVINWTRAVEESLLREVSEVVMHPSHALQLTQGLSTGAEALRKLLLMRFDPQTIFKGPLSLAKRAVWSQPIAIPLLKQTARITGSTINDVVLAAVSGALRRYLVAHEQPVADLYLRAVVPVNLRPIEEAADMGNRFGLVFLPLPVGVEEPLDRVFEVRGRMAAIKKSPEAILTFQILRLLGRTPRLLYDGVVTLFGQRATAVMTNVIGPPEPLSIAGTRLRQVMFWVPCSGRLGMGVSIFSYAGNLQVGIATDGSLVPDPGCIIDGFHAEIAGLTALVGEVQDKMDV